MLDLYYALLMSLHKGLPTWYHRRLEDKTGSSGLRRQQKTESIPATRSHLHPITSTNKKLMKNLQAQPGSFHRTTTRDVATPEETQKTARGSRHDYWIREPLG